ncbi:MAG: RNA polymerase sigma factor [Gammaproteobacteria bacterium]|nr:RNA polymerase sigma factor [Gammaproteobacteria bacterium]
MRNPDTSANTDTKRRLDAFLAQVERRAYRMALIATRQRDDALDIVQDAMFKLVRSYAHKPEAEWTPLFYRVLQTCILDWSRRRKVRNLWQRVLGGHDDDGEDPFALVPDSVHATPDHRVAQTAAMDALERALAQLPLRQHQAFLLRVWEGMDTAQTAQAMGCSEGSVKTHYSRAVHALRELLEEHA